MGALWGSLGDKDPFARCRGRYVFSGASGKHVYSSTGMGNVGRTVYKKVRGQTAIGKYKER